MPADTKTIADTLRHVLESLNHVIPNASNNTFTLLQAWNAILGGGDRDSHDVMVSVVEVYRALLKIEDQIRNSTLIDDVLRNVAIQTTQSLKPLFAPENFQGVAHPHKSRLNNGAVGHLAFIGLALKSEFSEPKLLEEQISSLLESLEEAHKLLQSSTLTLDLKIGLIRQIRTLIWWLQHPEISSIQDIFERAGAATIVAHQIEVSADTPEKVETSKAVTSKLGGVFKVVGSLMRYGITNVDQIEHAAHVAGKVIENR